MCFSSDKDAHHSLNLKEEIHFSVRGVDKWKELHLCYQHEVQLAQLSTFFSLERRYPTCCRAYFFLTPVAQCCRLDLQSSSAHAPGRIEIENGVARCAGSCSRGGS
jgi:hypothetical protein